MPDARGHTSPRRVSVTGSALILPSQTHDRPWLSIALDPREVLGPERGRRLDPFSLLSLVAIEAARRQAGLDAQRHDTTVRVEEGIAVGTALGACETSVRYARRLVHAGPAATNPIDFPDSIDGAPAAHIALDLGLGGPSLTFVDGTRSACAALVFAARQIAWGRCHRMHVVVGDRFDPLLAEVITQELPTVDPSPEAPRIVAECVLALILEPMTAPTAGAKELVGFLGKWADEAAPLVPNPMASLALGLDAGEGGERGFESFAWHLGETGNLHLVHPSPGSGAPRPWDPSGALAIGAAWTAITGSIEGGAGGPATAAPLAKRARCGRRDYPDLGFLDLGRS